jgi:hypothetical protein
MAGLLVLADEGVEFASIRFFFTGVLFCQDRL